MGNGPRKGGGHERKKSVDLQPALYQRFVRHLTENSSDASLIDFAGKKARITDSSDPDWVPSLNLEPSEENRPKRTELPQPARKPVEEMPTKQTNRRS